MKGVAVARRQSIGIKQQLTSLISSQKLTALAKKADLIQRRRKVGLVPLFWTHVLGYGGGHEKTIAGLRRLYETVTGVGLAPSSFYGRFSERLVRFLKAVLSHLLATLAATKTKYEGIFSAFSDVLLLDATIVRLHRMLEKHYPSCWTNHTKASAKLNLVMCLKDGGPRSVTFSEGRRHEAKNRRVGKWVEGKTGSLNKRKDRQGVNRSFP